MSKRAVTSEPIVEALAERWSPRSFDASAEIPVDRVTAALEAARWSPSANNSQPWRFVVARRGTPTFDAIASNLLGFNQQWAVNASVLIVNILDTRIPEGAKSTWQEYDLGQAVSHVVTQLHADGFYAHQMGGVKADGLRLALGLDEHYRVLTVTAAGVKAAPEALPDALHERELAERTRKGLDEIVLIRDER